MTGPRCEYCGHLNRAGAESCEACDFPAGGPRLTAGESSGQGSPADAIPSPPFKTAGDVISPMLAVYRKHFTTVGILVLVTTLPQSLLSYGVIEWVVASGGTGGGAAAAGLSLGNVLLWVVTIVASALLSGSLVYAVVDLQRAGGSSAGECLARGLKSLPKVFVVSLLQSLLTWVGFILLIVPGVILSLMYAVCVPAAVVEGLGPVGALKRSHELTKGRKGLIFITYFLWGLLITLLNWVVVWSFARGGSLDPLPATLLQTAVLGMLNSSLHVLTVYIYLGLLRERRGGFPARTFTQDAGAVAG